MILYLFSAGLNPELTELSVLREHYAELCDSITDISDLLKYFVQNGIITMDEEAVIHHTITQSEKVKKLLRHIVGPLKANKKKGFYAMLDIMKKYGVTATQTLAGELQSKVRSSDNPFSRIKLKYGKKFFCYVLHCIWRASQS